MHATMIRTAMMALLATQISARVARRDAGTNVAPLLTGLPTGWAYAGCYTDSQSSRTIDDDQTDDDSMTNQECMDYCGDRGYGFAGTEYTSQCFCGSALTTGAQKVDDSLCNWQCGGDSAQACGAPDYISVYTNPSAVLPSVLPKANGYCAIDCYTDSISARTLGNRVDTTGGTGAATVELCTAACAAGNYKYAGVEYGGECYCGNTIDNGATTTNICTMQCNGNSLEFCGGAGAMNLYGLCSSPSSSTVKSTSSVAPSTSSKPASSSSTPASSSSTPASSSSTPASSSSSKPASSSSSTPVSSSTSKPASSSSTSTPASSSSSKPASSTSTPASTSKPTSSSTAPSSTSKPASSTSSTKATTTPCNVPVTTAKPCTTLKTTTTTTSTKKPCSTPNQSTGTCAHWLNLGFFSICIG